MRNRKTMHQKNEKGITLIALVITIIVLLILAGISIVTLTGDNGILEKASTAGENTTLAKEVEIIKMAYSDMVTENIVNKTEITSDILQKKINTYQTANVEEVEEIPEGSNIINNGVVSGTKCKITMENVHYLVLEDSGNKVYIELYDGEKKVKTLSFNFEEGMSFKTWWGTNFVELEDKLLTEQFVGDMFYYDCDFYYDGSRYSMMVIQNDYNGVSTGDDKLVKGKVYSAYRR